MKKKIFLFFVSTLILFILFSETFGTESQPQSSQTHSQPTPSQVTSSFSPSGIIPRAQTPNPIGINFYFNPILADNNYQLKNGDTVCVGDTIDLKSGLSGEWFSKGGPEDSPPIIFVGNKEFNTFMSSSDQGASLPLTVYPVNGLLQLGRPSSTGPWIYYATVFCTSDMKVSGPFSNTNSFTVQKEGSIDISFSTSPSCGLYLEKTSCCGDVNVFFRRLYTLNPVSGFTFNLHLNAISQSQGAILQITDKSSSGQTIKIDVENTGDSNAILDDITSSIPLTITYKPSSIKPGTTEEIYLQTSQQVDLDSLQFQLSYRSDTLGCQKPLTQITTTSTSSQPPIRITSCSTNSQCSTGLCCQNQCRDSTKGVCRDINGDGNLEWVSIE